MALGLSNSQDSWKRFFSEIRVHNICCWVFLKEKGYPCLEFSQLVWKHLGMNTFGFFALSSLNISKNEKFISSGIEQCIFLCFIQFKFLLYRLISFSQPNKWKCPCSDGQLDASYKEHNPLNVGRKLDCNFITDFISWI